MACKKNTVFFLAELLVNLALILLIPISLGITRRERVVNRLVRFANRAFHNRSSHQHLGSGRSFIAFCEERRTKSGRKQGVFAQLTGNFYVNDDSIWDCYGTDSEQAIGIFSPRACGVYGYDTVYMPNNGSDGSGVFTLKSLHGTIRLHEQSAALLQVNKPSKQDRQGS